jgi:hypothetical protein
MTDESEAKDRAVLDFATYEDYLDSQITERDLFYLEVRPVTCLFPCTQRPWRCGLGTSYRPSPLPQRVHPLGVARIPGLSGGSLARQGYSHGRGRGAVGVSGGAGCKALGGGQLGSRALSLPLLDLCCPLQDEDTARHLVELGYHTAGDTLKREEFETRQKAEREKHLLKESVPKPLASVGKVLDGFPFLQSLANREELVRNGKLTVRGSREPHLVLTIKWNVQMHVPCLCWRLPGARPLPVAVHKAPGWHGSSSSSPRPLSSPATEWIPPAPPPTHPPHSRSASFL